VPVHSGGNQADCLEPVKQRWSRTWDLLGLAQPAPAVFADLVRRYQEPHRAYHTLHHLEECFDRFDEAAGLAERPGELLAALWFHDAVYDTHAADNEVRSALLAGEVIGRAGGSGELATRVGELVLATRHEARPAGVDQALIADIDLAILGAPAPRFDEYERQVRQEYDWVPEAAFRAARVRILNGFLARPTIFSTALFLDRFEDHARANLRRSLARLAGP
jgi:predicted metal-dependent HD superfamily phosphohydrolase